MNKPIDEYSESQSGPFPPVDATAHNSVQQSIIMSGASDVQVKREPMAIDDEATTNSTITVRKVSNNDIDQGGKSTRATTSSKEKDKKSRSSPSATNVASSTEAANDDKGTGDKNKHEHKHKDTMDIYDAIADIAANSHLRTRRRKRDRCDNSSVAPDDTTSTPNATTSQTADVTADVTADATKSTTTSSNSTSKSTMAASCYQPTIVTASMSNHYVPPRLHSRTRSLTNTSNRNSHSHSHNKNKVSVHTLNSVGLECGDDGVLRLERFGDDGTISNNNSTKDDFDVDAAIKTEENETRGDDDNNVAGVNKRWKQPMWASEQHKAFAAAIFEIGLKNCSPSIIMENMRKQPKYITRERTKSHLQKYRQTKERSKHEFLKEYDAFFKSTEQAKDLLNRKNCSSSTTNNNNNYKHKEPIPKAVLTTALEGKKPSKLLSGKAAALLSYSVLNDFSTNHGPDQLQYKAAKFSEFPFLTEEEKRSSVGASLLQVKSLIDNMTDALLKTRHGIKPFPTTRKTGIGDDESVSSSFCSSDDGYSYDDEDNDEGDAADNCKSSSKDHDPMAAAVAAAAQRGGPFGMATGPGGPTDPYYRGPPTAYPVPYPGQGAPPPQYVHAPPSFYGGGPPPPHLQAGGAPGFGGPTGYPAPPPLHYAQDPRMNPYQQAPPAQAGSYPGGPPMQPNYYPGVPGYPAYYGNTGDTNINASGSNEYPPPHASSSSDIYALPSRQVSDAHQQRQRQQQQSAYPQQQSSYANDGRGGDGRTYDLCDSSTEKSSRRRTEKRSKRRRERHRHSEKSQSQSLPLDTRRDIPRSSPNEFDFLDRISKLPSPTKSSRRSSSSPVQRSRSGGGGHGRTKSSSSINSEDSSQVASHKIIKPKRKERSRSRQLQEQQQLQYQQQFDTSAAYAKNFESPVDPFSEGDASLFGSSYAISPVHGPPAAEHHQNPRISQQLPNTPTASTTTNSSNNQFAWESSTFMDVAGYSDQQNTGGRDFHQPQIQPGAAFASGSEQPPPQLQQQIHRRYDGVSAQQQQEPMYLKGASFSSPDATPTSSTGNNYFFGE